MKESSNQKTPPYVKAAFGEKNRKKLIDEYFESELVQSVDIDSAWAHVYRLLLWVDSTNGLAHCYESDKSQPGKNWYGRSLAFHAWLSENLEASSIEVRSKIDWLFRKATLDLATEITYKAEKMAAAGKEARSAFAGKVFPDPREDPQLVEIVEESLGAYFSARPSEQTWRQLVQSLRAYFSIENKRKNLVGEGFEDVLASVIQRSIPESEIQVMTRVALNNIPGFSRERKGEKPNKVDLAIINSSHRTLVTAKWSVRVDREKQFTTEYAEYLTAESNNEKFDYVFITNEFDPARLRRACEKLVGNSFMFDSVVHINTDALRATYGDSQEESIQTVLSLIEEKRLISLQEWLGQLRQ